jgi:hypothetical protein
LAFTKPANDKGREMKQQVNPALRLPAGRYGQLLIKQKQITMKKATIIVLLVSVLFALLGCGNSSKKETYRIISEKKFGLTTITICYISDTSANELITIGKSIVGHDELSFAFFYTDSSQIKDITQFTNALDAIPGDGFFAKYTVETGLEKNINLYSTINQINGPIEIVFLESKSRKSKYYWYTYYVKNFADNKETELKMIEVAKQAKYTNNGFTEVFFFNDSINAPKLASDGGWGKDESQNSWNKKYGKYCVGYYSVGGGYSGEFTKGWK